MLIWLGLEEIIQDNLEIDGGQGIDATKKLNFSAMKDKNWGVIAIGCCIGQS